jgi:hypothetical protein
MPKRLKAELPGYEVRTVAEMRWAGKKNGELLQLAAQWFDALLTVDRNLEYQQNLGAVPLAVVVLVAPSNDVEDLRPLMPAVRQALPHLQPGQVLRVGA